MQPTLGGKVLCIIIGFLKILAVFDQLIELVLEVHAGVGVPALQEGALGDAQGGTVKLQMKLESYLRTSA